MLFLSQKLSIKKVEVKRTGFKRVGQQGNAPETPPPKKRDTKGSESRRSKGEKEVCMHPLYVVHLFYIHLPVSVHSLSTKLFSIYSTVCMYVHMYALNIRMYIAMILCTIFSSKLLMSTTYVCMCFWAYSQRNRMKNHQSQSLNQSL